MSTNINFEILMQDYQKSIAKIIGYTLEVLDFPLGINKLSKVLSGSQSSFIIKYELDKIPTYSLLQALKMDNIKIIIEELIKKELIEIGYVFKFTELPVLRLAPMGRQLLNDSIDIKFSFMKAIALSKIPALSEQEYPLFEKLKDKRKEIANAEDIPAYFVCKDITLIGIAKNKPVNEDELLKISGIGEKFIEKYSQIFIETINGFKDQPVESKEYQDKKSQNIDDDIEIKRQKIKDDYRKRHQESLRNRKREPRWLWTPYGGRRR